MREDRETRQLLLVAIFLCVAFVGKRSFDFLYRGLPFAKVGECLAIQSGRNTHYIVEVMENNLIYGTYTLKSLDDNEVFENVAYSDISTLDVKKVDCDEKAN